MKRETLAGILAEHPFFKDFNPQHLEFIAGCAANVRFNAGQKIFREGEEADYLYLLRYGKVAVQMTSAQRGTITIQTIGPGDVLGWSWILPPYKWHFDAQALELCRLVVLDGRCLRKKCADDPVMASELFKRLLLVVSERLEATRLQLLDLYGSY